MKTLVFTCLMAFSVALFAQSDFREGYIITSEMDTLTGFIDYRGADFMSDKCVFKVSGADKAQEFNPGEIYGYRIKDGKYYVSKEVDGSNGKTEYFWEYLLNGIVDVYFYRAEKKDHYMIENSKGEQYELKNEEKEIVIDRVTYLRDSKEYMGLLRLMFQDDPTTLRKVESMKLSHNSLIQISKEYHEAVCDDECIVYERKKNNLMPKIGLAFEYHRQNMSSNMDLDGAETYLKYPWSAYTPTFGVFLKFPLSELNERFFVQIQSTVGKTKLVNEATYVKQDIHYKDESEYNALMVASKLNIGYQLPKGQFQPRVLAGVHLNMFLNSEFKREQVATFSFGEPYFTATARKNPFQDREFGFNAGVGVAFVPKEEGRRELTLDLIYCRGKGMEGHLRSNNLSLVLGWNIF